MRYLAFSLVVSLALTGIAFGSVVLDVVDGGPVNVGGGLILHKYTVTAEGAGITTLSKFTITTPVYQTIANSEWTQSGLLNFPNDSHVIFGDVRLPDLKGSGVPPPAGAPAVVTEETGNYSLGTLNNYDDVNDLYDSYIKTGINQDGSTPVLTHNMMQLLVAEDDELELSLQISTHTGYDVDEVIYRDDYGNIIDTRYYAVGGTVETFDLMIGRTYLPGDANKDGKVSLPDLDTLGTNWGKEENALWEEGDFTGDGKVSLPDLDALGTYWGQESPWYSGGAEALIPEPSSIAMLIMGTLCLLGYRAGK